MINQERIVERFLRYIQIDSETRHEKEIADMLVDELMAIGMDVQRDNAGDKIGGNAGNIIAKLKGDLDKPAILLSAHMDTVTPGNGVKPIVENGIIKSDGRTVLGSDDKAGIAGIIEGVQAIVEAGVSHGPIEIVFCIAEEGGLNGSKYLDYNMVDAKMGFVFDSGGKTGEVIVQGPAQDKIDVTIKGRPAHAGVAPEEGISAIQVAAAAISKMSLLRIDADTTANVGVIQGGLATNIVTPEVTIQAEARSLKNEKLDVQTAHMVQCFEEAAAEFGAEAIVETSRAYTAFHADQDSEVIAVIDRALAAMKIEPNYKPTGGGSDTNNYNQNGIQAINLGVGMQKVHTLEEFIEIEDLISTGNLVTEIIKNV